MNDRTPLPHLDEERIDRMEHRIVEARRSERSRRRKRVVGTVGSVAAVLAVAAFVGPIVSGTNSFTATSGAMDTGGDSGAVSTAEGYVMPESGGLDSVPAPASGDVSRVDGGSSDPAVVGGSATEGREIVTTAYVALQVRSVPTALAAITATATDLGGYVESSDSSSDGSSPVIPYVEGGAPMTTDDSGMVVPAPVGSGYITIRVPADRLQDAQDSLTSLGTVTQQSTNRQDITTQTVDLRARLDAAQASVERLTALMAQAGSVSDLIAAESALAERQAELESLQQQLTAIESQVSLSTLTVSLSPRTTVETAEPTGFLDGLVSGWNGLIASANGLLVGLGFLLPWLVLAGLVTAVVVAIRRVRRRRREGARP